MSPSACAHDLSVKHLFLMMASGKRLSVGADVKLLRTLRMESQKNRNYPQEIVFQVLSLVRKGSWQTQVRRSQLLNTEGAPVAAIL